MIGGPDREFHITFDDLSGEAQENFRKFIKDCGLNTDEKSYDFLAVVGPEDVEEL